REQVHGSGSGAFVLISPPDGATLIAGGGVAYWRILEPGTVFRGPLDPVIQSDFVDLNPYGFCATPRGDPCFTFGRAGDEPVDLVFTTCPEKCIVENGDVQ